MHLFLSLVAGSPAAAMTIHFLPSDAYFATSTEGLEGALAQAGGRVEIPYVPPSRVQMACGTAGYDRLGITHLSRADRAGLREAIAQAEHALRSQAPIVETIVVVAVDRAIDPDALPLGARHNEHFLDEARTLSLGEHLPDARPHALDEAIGPLPLVSVPEVRRWVDPDGTRHLDRGTIEADARELQWIVALGRAWSGEAPAARWSVRRGRVRYHPGAR